MHKIVPCLRISTNLRMHLPLAYAEHEFGIRALTDFLQRDDIEDALGIPRSLSRHAVSADSAQVSCIAGGEHIRSGVIGGMIDRHKQKIPD